MSPTRLPLPLRALSRLLPPEIGDAAMGDVLEEYAKRLDAHGRLRATAWCWRQLLSPDVVRLRRELDRGGGRG